MLSVNITTVILLYFYLHYSFVGFVQAVCRISCVVGLRNCETVHMHTVVVAFILQFVIMGHLGSVY
jgi:hypothetical protein